MPSLRVVREEGVPEIVSVYKPVMTFGASPVCDVQLCGEGILDMHAQLVFDGKEFAIAEWEKGACLVVNGKRRRRSKLFHQDRVDIGAHHLLFSSFDEQGAARGSLEKGGRQELLAGMRQLAEFNRGLWELDTLEKQLECLMDAVVSLCHADKGFVVLLDNGRPHISVARGISHNELPRDVDQLSDSILQRVIEGRQPVIVSDALQDEKFRNSQSVMSLRLCSVMCVPMVTRNQMLGIIYVGNDRVANLFEHTHLEALMIFATQASLLLQNALLLDQLVADKQQLTEELAEKRFGDIIGSCSGLIDVFRDLEKVAATDIPVLITGDTGTGKELVARELHRRSDRASQPFVVVNCGAIPEQLIESELFGHVRGAFTGAVATRQGKFQLADRGTLFLDEIGELPVNMQVKLLRVLQEQEITKVGDGRAEKIDVRVVSATHRDLHEGVQTGMFREDLLYRLNVINLRMPPLRERGDDVVLLAKYFLSKYAGQYKKKIAGFDTNALAAMRRYEWPGNIRQLENRIKKAVVLCDGALVTAESLDLREEDMQSLLPMAQAREAFQRSYVLKALERNNGNRTKTARDLDVDPRTIFRYLEGVSDEPPCLK